MRIVEPVNRITDKKHRAYLIVWRNPVLVVEANGKRHAVEDERIGSEFCNFLNIEV